MSENIRSSWTHQLFCLHSPPLTELSTIWRINGHKFYTDFYCCTFCNLSCALHTHTIHPLTHDMTTFPQLPEVCGISSYFYTWLELSLSETSAHFHKNYGGIYNLSNEYLIIWSYFFLWASIHLYLCIHWSCDSRA